MEESSEGSWRDSYRGMSSDNVKGLVLALSSSFFIGASFIVKKKGLKKAGSSGVRAGLFLFLIPKCLFCWLIFAVEYLQVFFFFFINLIALIMSLV